jgi:hypothetical protein
MCVFKYHAFIFCMRPPRWRSETVLTLKCWKRNNNEKLLFHNQLSHYWHYGVQIIRSVYRRAKCRLYRYIPNEDIDNKHSYWTSEVVFTVRKWSRWNGLEQVTPEAVFTDTKFVIYDPEFHQRRHFHRDLYLVFIK